MSNDEWWEFCPVCQACDEIDECEEPCAMAMGFLNGGINGTI